MAVKGFTQSTSKGIRAGDIAGKWNLKAGDTAAPLLCPRYSDKSVHIFGVWGGATVTLRGGNDDQLAQFEDMYDPSAVSIVQSAAHAPWIVFPNVLALKPVISGGDGTTDLTVAIVGRGRD